MCRRRRERVEDLAVLGQLVLAYAVDPVEVGQGRRVSVAVKALAERVPRPPAKVCW
jgi:hypothetical protein